VLRPKVRFVDAMRASVVLLGFIRPLLMGCWSEAVPFGIFPHLDWTAAFLADGPAWQDVIEGPNPYAGYRSERYASDDEE